jgi:SAM-dependent methyltransferase
MSQCLWCGGRLRFWQVLRDEYLGVYPDPVSYGRCEACGSLGQIEALSADELGKAYPAGYWQEEESPSRLSRLALWYQKKMVAIDQGRFARRALGSLRGKRVLEIGPGRGDFLQWAKDQGADVEGWERAPQAVSCLRRQGLTAKIVVLEDVRRWPISQERFDLIVGFHVLEHLGDPRQIVAALAEYLAPHGAMVFQLPRADSWQAEFLGKRWIGLDPPRHITVPTLKGINYLITRLGFEDFHYRNFSLRDNASIIVSSVLPSLGPHRPGFAGFRVVGHLLGVWLLQPVALIEALAGKGGTISLCLRKNSD